MRTVHGHRQYFWLAAALFALFTALAPVTAARKPAPPAEPVPPGAAGAYRDAQGTRHDWRVNPAFALLWENTPYLPAGLVLSPKSFLEPDKAEAWSADQEWLRAVKQGGVTDVFVRPGRPAASIPTAAWQRLIDFLEAEGFRYGVALPIAPPAGATGYSVHAGTYHAGPTAAGGPQSVEIHFPGLTAANIQRVACAITDQKSSRLVSVRWATLEPLADGVRATVNLLPPAGAQYSVEMTPVLTGVPGVPDLWNGFDDARDSLLPLKQVKFGPGLRFFSHPFSGLIDLEGAGRYLIPNSDSYRLAFEAFLTKRYRSASLLRTRWAFRGDEPITPETAARLVPLAIVDVRGDRIGYLLDEKQQKCYIIDATDSAFWYDHLYFREDSLREQMMNMAQFTRDQLADVPVVVQRSGGLRNFQVNAQPVGGFSGIGIRAGAENLSSEAGYAAGAARMAAARPWCMALSLEGIAGKDALLGALETARQVGIKGWFVAPDEAAPGDVASWLAGFAKTLAKPGIADYAPRYVLFPHSIPETGGFSRQHPDIEAEVRQLAPGVWWVPTLAAWQALDLGPEIHGYAFRTGVTDDIYLWTTKGKQRIHLRLAALGSIEVRDAAGKVIRRQNDRKLLQLDLSDRVVILTGTTAAQVVPVELVVSEMAEYERLVKLVGIRQGEVNEFQRILGLARDLGPDRFPKEVRNLIHTPLEALRRAVKEPAVSPLEAPPAEGRR